MNLGDIPRRNARRYPHRVGLVFEDVRLTWAEVDERVNRLANALGVERGERVAILGENDHRYLESYWALAKLGAIAVPLSYRLLDQDLVTLIEHSEPVAILAGRGYEETARRLGVDRVICFDGDYEPLLASSTPTEPEPRAGADDPFAIMYTSGTTGLPKGALVTHGNLESNAYNQAIADKADPRDVNLTATPLYHMGALFMTTTYTCLGCTNVILERFDEDAVLHAIAAERATTCLLVPTMLNRVLNHPELASHDLSSLRLMFYGGATIPSPLLRRAIDAFGCAFTQGYGLTETIEATFLTAEDHVLDGDPERERRLASAGREAVNAEVRIVDEDGVELPPGEVGEIAIRSPSVIREYWRAPEETRAAIRDGWFFTGDVGYRDEAGYLFVVDRKKDVIISGGTNVFPKEVEEALFAHPAVLEAAVIGLPDDEWGEAVTAVVVLRAGHAAGERELIAHCGERVAGFKKPKSVRFVETLPRNPSGKVLKRELRERFRGTLAGSTR
ncbi:MAG TPA: long-chain fatty acid--CoA ligase [Gaiellaceae bacterium]|nr:long-chain fatty acid--CoA ligase [Gaiellaceae bacterium]